MSDKQHILDSISAIARGLGRAPTRSEFVALAKISEYFVSQCFQAGMMPLDQRDSTPTPLNVRLEDSELLKDWGETVRANRAIPARRAYRRVGKYDPRTLERRFGPWSSLPQVFLNFSKDNPEWGGCRGASARSRIKAGAWIEQRPGFPNSAEENTHVPLRDRATYGNPTHFRGLRYEPANEQGRRTSLWDARQRTRLRDRGGSNGVSRLRGQAPDCSGTLATRGHRI